MKLELPNLKLPHAVDLPYYNFKPPNVRMPSYKPMVIPPSDLRAPQGVEQETTGEQTEAPKLQIPVLDIQMPLPTAEVVMTATYAAVAAVATTTLATPFFNQIKKKLQKFLQGKIDKWKENRKKVSSES